MRCSHFSACGCCCAAFCYCHCGRNTIPIRSSILLDIARVVEYFALPEFVYQGLFAGVELVCYALGEGHEFDEQEVEAGDVDFGVGEVVGFGSGLREGFGHCGGEDDALVDGIGMCM